METQTKILAILNVAKNGEGFTWGNSFAAAYGA